jgi:hypothetical protein
MTRSRNQSRIARLGSGKPAPVDADPLRALAAAQRETSEQLARETAELRREAADLLSRSRGWRDERRRELLRHRRWYGVHLGPQGTGPGEEGPADA